MVGPEVGLEHLRRFREHAGILELNSCGLVNAPFPRVVISSGEKSLIPNVLPSVDVMVLGFVVVVTSQF